MCHDYDAGAELIDRALGYNENLAVAWQLRALASLWMGKHQEAVQQMHRAMRLNPKDPEAFRSEIGIATALMLQGDMDQAVIWARRCLARNPDWPPGLVSAVPILAHAGHLDEARAMAKHLCAVVPGTTISGYKSQSPLRETQDIARALEGLRIAGLPE
jgi:tetratricopeptide (TPR) repeat protein